MPPANQPPIRKTLHRTRVPLRIRGVDQMVSPDEVDVADLLLEMANEHNVVPRTTLITAWKELTPDVRDSVNAAAYTARDKGALAAKYLKDALVGLEKLGAVRRAGKAPQHVVIIEDRALLQQMVEHWDTAPPEHQEDALMPRGTAPETEFTNVEAINSAADRPDLA